ncbi:hypothetical protein PybrP1_009401 [[Pythium] brassicae (nom. inval.)]|nr:hypothetical protein PybrP1_009401 [[Pythium] brassicae (nom. inval.)]
MATQQKGTAEFRAVHVNAPARNAELGYCDNFIVTSKYTLVSFVPKFLFETFRKLANLYFLAICTMQCVPAISNTNGQPSTLPPLAFIIFVDAVFAVLEDRKRHVADAVANSRPTLVLDASSKAFVIKRWADCTLGDMGAVENLLAMRGEVRCEQPNNAINSFQGVLELEGRPKQSIPYDSILLRGCIVRNTDWVHGVVLNTGRDTKIMMSNSAPPSKMSTMDQSINQYIGALLVVLVVFSAVGATGAVVWRQRSGAPWYLALDETSDSAGAVWVVMLFYYLLLMYQFVPISLCVSMSMVKYLQAQFIQWDQQMYHGATDTASPAKNAVPYVNFDGPELFADMKGGAGAAQQRRIDAFFTHLAVCHTVIPERHENSSAVTLSASSPDEQALVAGAGFFGYEFVNRAPGVVHARIQGQDRKSEAAQLQDVTRRHIDAYAEEGLRTLTIATRELAPAHYDEWARRHFPTSELVEAELQAQINARSAEVRAYLEAPVASRGELKSIALVIDGETLRHALGGSSRPLLAELSHVENASYDGASGSMWLLGNIVFTLVVLVANAKLMLYQNSFHALNHVLYWGSFVTWLLVALVAGQVTQFSDLTWEKMTEQMFMTNAFWALLLFTPIAALSYAYLISGLKLAFAPEYWQLAKEVVKFGLDKQLLHWDDNTNASVPVPVRIKPAGRRRTRLGLVVPTNAMSALVRRNVLTNPHNGFAFSVDAHAHAEEAHRTMTGASTRSVREP